MLRGNQRNGMSYRVRRSAGAAVNLVSADVAQISVLRCCSSKVANCCGDRLLNSQKRLRRKGTVKQQPVTRNTTKGGDHDPPRGRNACALFKRRTAVPNTVHPTSMRRLIPRAEERLRMAELNREDRISSQSGSATACPRRWR